MELFRISIIYLSHNNHNPAQDKKLGNSDTKKLKEQVKEDGYDNLEDLKVSGEKGAQKYELYVKPNGNIVVKPIGDGKMDGEPTGLIYES